MMDIQTPSFDGDSSKVFQWMDDLEETFCQYRLKVDKPLPIDFILNAIRSTLSSNAAIWWDACSARYCDDLKSMLRSFMELVTTEHRHEAITIRSPRQLIDKMNLVFEKGIYHDITLIMITLQAIDCPKLQKRLHSFLRENPTTSWHIFEWCVRRFYRFEAKQQNDLCRPIRCLHKGLNRVWFENMDVYKFRRENAYANFQSIYCLLCESVQHYTSQCHLMDEIELLK